MNVITTVAAMQAMAEGLRQEGRYIGLVPTMGCFHEGHLTLMRAARRECDRVVVSLFVNPLQFGPREDFARYPRDSARDRSLADKEGADVFFEPEEGDIYPPGHAAYVDVEGITRPLCGAFRPGHFRGVATVVAKLFNICKPHVAFFGRKDYQQAQVIKQMVRDLNFDVRIEVLPTVRESDGLAMSSRNETLSPPQRRQALCLVRALRAAQTHFADGETRPGSLREAMADVIGGENGVRFEYAEILDGETLEPVPAAREGTLAAVAAYVGTTRLIDNTILGRDDLPEV